MYCMCYIHAQVHYYVGVTAITIKFTTCLQIVLHVWEKPQCQMLHAHLTCIYNVMYVYSHHTVHIQFVHNIDDVCSIYVAVVLFKMYIFTDT